MARILLVDDELVYLDELSSALRSLSHDVTCAASIQEANACIANESYDLAICDTIMEGGGALTLLHQIRANDPDFPFVVITGRPEVASSPLFQKGMSEADAKLEKSATIYEIDQIIRSILRRS